MDAVDLTLEDLTARLAEWGEPAYRARQIHAQRWRRGIAVNGERGPAGNEPRELVLVQSRGNGAAQQHRIERIPGGGVAGQGLIRVELDGNRVLLDGKDVTTAIRRVDITTLIHHAADNAAVRGQLVLWQRAAAEKVRSIVEGRPAYLTLDIDFLDPAYAPGTGTPVIGGPTTYQARELLFGLRGLNVVGGDQVEVAPAYDPMGQITALAGATLATDVLYLIGLARAGRAS